MKRYQIVPNLPLWLGRFPGLSVLTFALAVLLLASPLANGQALPPPSISGFSPTSGPVGTKVTITGQNFGGVSAVMFNNVSAQFTAFDTTQIVATVPSGATDGPVTVVTGGGSAASTAMFTVTESLPPVITDFTPGSGAVGTEVTLTGQNFAGTTGVQFNGIVAVFQSGFSGTNLTATVPTGATTGPISVITPVGAYTTQTSFVVTNTPPPSITDFSPQSGPAGTQVVLNGSNLGGTTSVTFNGVKASFSVFGTTVTAVVPAAAGTGPITVVTPGGSATSTANFVFVAPAAPSITSISPTSGQAGDRVTISGANLDTATAVAFNGVAATFSIFGSFIFATVPSTATTGPITVTNPAGTATSAATFTVNNAFAPRISSFSPNSGGPGVEVSITGTNLDNVTSVLIGGASASFTSVSNSELHATVPAGATTGSIVIDNQAGTATSSDLFFVPATISSFTPTVGSAGTTVTIQGLNFTGAFAVLFGSVSANFTSVSPSEIQATVPQGAASGAISIATPAGFAISTTRFLLPPSITSFFPASGPEGTDITISGASLLDTTSVLLGGTSLTFSVTSANSVVAKVSNGAMSGPITVTTPAGSATSSDPFYVGSFDDLTVDVKPSSDTVSVGDFLSYSIAVKNLGPLDAPNVVLTDRLPPGASLISAPSTCFTTNNMTICNLGSVAAGANLTVRLSVSVGGDAYLTNQVNVVTTGSDPDLSNNSATTITVLNGVIPPPVDVALSIAHESNLVEISWPTPAPGFVLESSPSLTPPVQWTTVTDAGVELNGRITVTQSISGTTRFYRLHKP
jgi:uncharacterized repeat protein (TIGR01451 family)